jgi:cyclophilin family peptidyl-prolyl cis-trans isomerase
MAWSATDDERTTGQDAPFSFSTAFGLAEGEAQAAFGLLVPSASGDADGDLYALGTLLRGTYFIRALASDWYTGAGSFGVISPLVALYVSTSTAPVRTGDGGIAFLLNEPGLIEQGSYYVGVIGSGTTASQYRLEYEWLRPQAGLGQLAVAGDPVVGNTLSPQGWLVEPDGASSSYRAFRWIADGQLVGSASTLPIGEPLAGRSLSLEVDYLDDAGYLTTLYSPAVTIAGRDPTSPSIQISASRTDLGYLPSTTLAFQLSADALDFTVDDVRVEGGWLRDFTGSGRQYAAQFVPDAGRIGQAKVSVPSGVFSNAVGVLNQDGSDADNSLIIRYDASSPRLQWSTDARIESLPVVAFETTQGSFSIELDADKAPLTVSNVLAYVKDGFYDGLVFHRSIPGFMVQGGGFESGGIYAQPTYSPVPLEADNGLLNVRGSVAMARTSDPDSATSQFFVNFVDNAFLNQTQDGSGSQPANGYTVFGHVVAGMETIDAMAAVPTGSLRPLGTEGQSLSDYPLQDITIIRAEPIAPGLAVSELPGATLPLKDRDPAAEWSYSLDGGATWQAGQDDSVPVPEGRYGTGAIQVRYEAASGVPGIDTNALPMDLIVDDPDTGRVAVQVYHWRSHQLIEGVELKTSMEQATSQTSGAVSMRGGPDAWLELSAVPPSDGGPAMQAARAAVGLNDAISVLRMAVGQKALDGDAGGLSPFQRLAADVDGDGTVSLRDALGALRLASGASSPAASSSPWRLVDERALTPEAAISSPGADYAVASIAVDPAALAETQHGFVALVIGDVDGSYQGRPSDERLDTSYFERLVGEVDGLDLARFGIGG